MYHCFCLTHSGTPQHGRQSSLPPPATGLFRSTELKEDFLSTVQPQSFPSFQPPNTGTLQGESLHTHREAQTSVSAPATGLVHILPQEQPPQYSSQSSGPDSLPMYQHSPSSEHRGSQDSSSFPRPPSNADLHLPSGGLLMSETTNYPFTNADLPPSVSHPSTNAPRPITNEGHGITHDSNRDVKHHPNNITTGGDTATPRTNFDPNPPNGLTQPPGLVPDNARRTLEVDHLPSLSSPLNQSMSSLLDSSQEDFTSHSPIRLLPPAPDQSSMATSVSPVKSL